MGVDRGISAVRGKAKARSSEQARAAVMARWKRAKKKSTGPQMRRAMAVSSMASPARTSLAGAGRVFLPRPRRKCGRNPRQRRVDPRICPSDGISSGIYCRPACSCRLGILIRSSFARTRSAIASRDPRSVRFPLRRTHGMYVPSPRREQTHINRFTSPSKC